MGSTLSIASLAGLDRDAFDARIANADDAAVETLVDELADRSAQRLSMSPFDRDAFVMHIVIIERRDVYERDITRANGSWSVAPGGSTPADMVSRWQGLAPIVWCENGELHLSSAVAVGYCQTDGDLVGQEQITRALASGDTASPLAQLYLVRGLPDRDVQRALERLDMQTLMREMCEVGAEVSRHGLGLGQRDAVVQLDVEFGGRTYSAQTTTTAEAVTVVDGTPAEPSVVIRFPNAIDFARTCTGERTAVELVAGGAVELKGDISVFAQFDRIRF